MKSSQHFLLSYVFYASFSLEILIEVIYQVPLCKHLSDLSGRANMVLPVPAFTVLSGGKHASNTFAIQVFNIKFTINFSVLPLSHNLLSYFSLAPQSSSRMLLGFK